MARHLLLFLLSLTLVRAQTSEADRPSADSPRPILSRITGIFDDLPQLDLPGTFKVLFRPHFGDLANRDYMRVETGLRWALNDRFSVSGEGSVFFTHGLDGNHGSGYGIGRVRLGSQYLLRSWPRSRYDTSLNLTLEAPVGHPPVDMTDGQYHLTPGFIVQRRSDRLPRLTTFGGLGLDLIDASSIPGQFGTNQPREDSFNGTVGAIYDMGQIKWTLSGTYASTALLGEQTEHFYYLQPGLQWYVPKRLTLNSKTQWIASFGIRTSWGPDGTDISFRTRLRAEITFRQLMRNIRERSTGRPAPAATP